MGLPLPVTPFDRATYFDWEARQVEKLEVEAADAVFYPDVMVSRDAEDRQRALALRAPCLIVEVLSDSTAAFDRGARFAAYRQLASLQEVLFVDIDARRLELYRREAEGWLLSEIRQGAAPADPEAALALHSIDLRLRCTDAFEDLDADAG